MATQTLFAAVEGGGTSFVLTIAELLQPATSEGYHRDASIPHTNFKVLKKASIPTSSPAETLAQSVAFFERHRPTKGYFDALGICTFGPVGVNPAQPCSYGRILPGSPKKDWRNVDILSPILKACSSPDGKLKPVYKVDTDVNAPAMAEFEYRSKTLKEDITSLAYVTVGTGIGIGLVINCKPVHGMMHPEGGHVTVAPLTKGDSFTYSWGANCPYKGTNTVEGSASSVALTEILASTTTNYNNEGMVSSSDASKREGLKDLSDDHIVWDHAANALANLCVTLTLITSVEKIIFGGGVMNRTILYDKIRSRTKELLNGYLDLQQVNTEAGLKDYIGPSVWKESDGHGAGLVGSLVLAQIAFDEQNSKSESEDEPKCIVKRTKNMLSANGGAVSVGIVSSIMLSAFCLFVATKGKKH